MATTSSGTITSVTSNGTSRITGLSSGIDVDSLVEQLMSAEKYKLNRLKQQQQLATWRQEQYREMTTSITAFADKYLNTLSTSSMLSQSTYTQFAVTSSSSAVTAKAGATATAATHTIEVSQLATAATLASSSGITANIQGSGSADFTSAQGASFVLTVDDTSRTVTLGTDVQDVEDLQEAVDTAVGTDKVTVSVDEEGLITFSAVDGSGVQQITLAAPSSGSSALTALGFSDGDALTNRLSTTDTLETIAAKLGTAFTFNDEGQLSFTINDVDFTFDMDDTLAEMISEINSSDAKVTMKYDSLTDQLSLTATETGAGATLTASEDGGTFLASVLNQATAGTDANLTLDGQSLTRSSNTLTVNGVTYTLNAVTTEAATIGVTRDTDAIYDAINNFVTDYNSLIDLINTKISEDYDSDYPPLTEDQEAEMSESEIEKWNEKATTGLLHSDSMLQKMLSSLRETMLTSVAGESATFYTIGITTGTYDEKGKLHIDEDKLKAALESDPEGVRDLFCKQSTSYSGTTTVRSLNSSERAVRYQEEGIAYRFYDVLQDYIGTSRDLSGNKGLLLEKAGMENDASDTDNILTDQLNDLADRIAAEEERLEDKETQYYNKYTYMETYISTLTAQLAAFSSDSSSS